MIKMNHLIRSISGIRGIVGKTFTYDLIKSHINAFLTMQDDGAILVAYDGRSHGKDFLKYALDIIISAGRIAVNCGLIPTPTAQFLIKQHGYSGGILITASHNPPEWNGLKFIDSNACFTSPQKTLQLFEYADIGKTPGNSTAGSIQHENELWNDHVKHTLGLPMLNIDRIKRRKFRIVVDAVNCTGSIILPYLLDKMGCEVIQLNCNGTGEFTRGAEPLPENLMDLCNSTKEYNADLGLATDPDGDRLAVVDDTGHPPGEEFTLPFCMDGYFIESSTTSPAVVNLSSSMLNDWVCSKHKVKLVRSSVGEINVVEKMKECGSKIGGEGNGGVILAESHFGRDSIVAAALFLNRLSMEVNPLSECSTNFPNYIMTKDKISIDGLNLEEIFKRIKEEYRSVELNELDGIKLIWPEKWIHIRPSNTEPILRIYAESEDENQLKREINNIKNSIHSID